MANRCSAPQGRHTITTSITNQHEHHNKETFMDEYRAFLKKHAVEYDERYVWD